MRSAEYPFLADWVAITTRWISLLSFAAALALSGGNHPVSEVLLFGAAAWNCFNSVLAILNKRLTIHRPINVAVDGLLSLILFALNDGSNGPLAWSGLLVFFSAAIYYELKGSMAVVAVLTALEVAVVALTTSAWPQMGLTAGFNIMTGGIFGAISLRLMDKLRANYQATLRNRAEKERNVQLTERSRMQTFYQLAETLSASLNYQTVLDTSLDLCTTALGGPETSAGQMASAVLLFTEEGSLQVSAYRRLPLADQNLNVPAKEGALKATISTAEPTLVENPTADPELSRMVLSQSAAAMLLLPLVRGLNSFGVMLFAHPEAGFFDTDRTEALEMISHQAMIAIQNARLYDDLQAEKERIVETQEEARKKLARDLHDGPTQSLAAIAMRINIARKLFETNPPEAVAELMRTEDLARRTTSEVRHMLFTLRPLILETEGLIPALKAMSARMMDTYQQKVRIQADPAVVTELEMGKQTVVFYLAEEAVNNARKHAKADLITVRLVFASPDRSIAGLEITDNGVGFDVEAVTSAYESRGSLGLVNLRERTDLIGGMLTIDSAPGKGTRIRVFIPLNQEAADRLERSRTVPTTNP